MNKGGEIIKKEKLILLAIIILALFLRIYKIGENPQAAYGDEIAFGYNAYSILKTGQDEYGNFLPLQFKSFNDYKAPLPVYLLVPFIKIFDLNAFSIRLPIVISGTLTVLVFYLLMKKLLGKPEIALISAFLLAVSSWHIHLSRGLFEANLALLFFLAGILFFLESLKKPAIFFLSIISFSLCLYSYFTPRILLLFFLPFIYLWWRRDLIKIKRTLFLGLLLFLVLMIPLIRMTFFQSGVTRFTELMKTRLDKTSEAVIRERTGSAAPEILKKLTHNKLTVIVRNIKDDYLEHFSINFLYLYGDNSLRYFLGNMGMFYLMELPFLLIGIWYLLKEEKKIALFFLGWWIITPIPAALVGRSFAIRSMPVMFPIFALVSYGIYKSISMVKKKANRRVLLIVIGVGYFLSVGSYFYRYHYEYIKYAACWWGCENKAEIDLAVANYNKYDQIFLSDYYTGLPLALAFYLKIDPNKYRQMLKNNVVIADNKVQLKYKKIYIGSLDLNKERMKDGILPKKTLYVGRPEEPTSTDTIRALEDGRVLFYIYKTDNKGFLTN